MMTIALGEKGKAMSRYIDADALKEKYTMVIKRYSGGIMERPAVLLETIDDAPHINLADYVPKDFHDKTCEAMAKAHQAEILKLTADRPQGEWIHDDSSPIAYRCTACNTLQHWSVIQNGRYRFCPNCGARMKGADDE